MIPVPAIRGIRYNLKLDVKPSRYITARLRMWYVIFLLPCICDTVHHWELCLNSDCIQWIALRSMWWWCDDTNSASRRVVEMKSKCYPTSHVVQCPRKIFMQLSCSFSSYSIRIIVIYVYRLLSAFCKNLDPGSAHCEKRQRLRLLLWNCVRDKSWIKAHLKRPSAN